MVWRRAQQAWGALRISPEVLSADPVLAERALSPERVCEVAGVQRLADIGPRNTAVVPADQLLDPKKRLLTLRHALSEGVLILFVDTKTEEEQSLIVSELRELAVRLDEASSAEAGALYGVRVAKLLQQCLERDPVGTEEALRNMPTHRMSTQAIAILPASAPVHRVGWLHRALLQPSFPVYLIVFVYSSLRVLPVAFVSQFQGSLLVLWLIDVVTAVPYTWGVLAMLFARKRGIRLLATVTTLTTFIGPYVYFWLNGSGYPIYVPIVIAALTLLSVLLEVSKYQQEQRLGRSYRAASKASVRAAALR